jgi:predicted nuclease with TOPRIM domain
MKELEKEYIELSKKYVESQEELKKTKKELKSLEKKYKDIIDTNIEITKNANEISEDYLKLTKENIMLKELHKYGAFIDLSNGDKIFIPFLSDNLTEIDKLPNNVNITGFSFNFKPQFFMEWADKIKLKIDG